jgi:hypothetical protein
MQTVQMNSIRSSSIAILFGLLAVANVESFLIPPTAIGRKSCFALPGNVIVDSLREGLKEDSKNSTLISRYIFDLEAIGVGDIDDSDEKRFDRLIGLYNVAFVKTAKEGENPVGGKWTRKNGLTQKILRTRRTFQHILPVNETGHGAWKVQTGEGELDVVGEAVNVVSLESLWGLVRATIILRGDAVALNATERIDNTCQPLSALSVRALFDAPRIILGKTGQFLNINVGPKTSVILDTLYIDDKVRIGLGGRSGSRFIFERCANDDVEANEFRQLIARKPWGKMRTMASLLTGSGLGLYAAIARGYNIIGGCVAAVTSIVAALIVFSGGGIEANDRSVDEAKKIYEKTQVTTN